MCMVTGSMVLSVRGCCLETTAAARSPCCEFFDYSERDTEVEGGWVKSKTFTSTYY